MDNDRVRGTAKQIKGSVKEAIGKITGNRKLEAEGAAEQQLDKHQAASADNSSERDMLQN
ncbi:CsbD family protein [Bradyrhizobium japonicum]|uniref:CsbD family protein n=1 Tax=Bradyrhizobium japonicum TaxID=375 RepID=UPI000462B8F5|nr:CsbD family protein [Bradyrhizobium japonicum]